MLGTLSDNAFEATWTQVPVTRKKGEWIWGRKNVCCLSTLIARIAQKVTQNHQQSPLFLGWPWNIRARHRWNAQTCDNLEWYLRTLTPLLEAKHLKDRSSCLPVISLVDPAESCALESRELIPFVRGYKEPPIMGTYACKLTHRNLSKHPARLSFLDEKHCSLLERLKTFSLAI